MNDFRLMLLTCFLILLFLICMPINLKSKIVFNVLQNTGKIELKLFKLNMFYAQMSIQSGFIELHSQKGKTFLIPIVVGENEQLKETDIVLLILQKIYVEHGTMYVNFGLKDDAFLTAMSIGLTKTITSIVAAIFQSKKIESKIKNKVYPCFNKDKFIVCLKASIKISIYKILLSFMQSKFRKIKNNKEILQNE